MELAGVHEAGGHPRPLQPAEGDGCAACQRLEQSPGREITGVHLELTDSEKRLKVEIFGLQERMVHSDLNVRDGLKADIADLRDSIQKSKSDTIKWMFLFWIGQIGAVLGIILAVFR